MKAKSGSNVKLEVFGEGVANNLQTFCSMEVGPNSAPVTFHPVERRRFSFLKIKIEQSAIIPCVCVDEIGRNIPKIIKVDGIAIFG